MEGHSPASHARLVRGSISEMQSFHPRPPVSAPGVVEDMDATDPALMPADLELSQSQESLCWQILGLCSVPGLVLWCLSFRSRRCVLTHVFMEQLASEPAAQEAQVA